MQFCYSYSRLFLIKIYFYYKKNLKRRTSSDSMMLQHCPKEVTGCRLNPNIILGRDHDSQYPRQAFVVISNLRQSGIVMFFL